MRTIHHTSIFAAPALAMLLAVSSAQSQTYWTGSNIGFYHTDENAAADIWTSDEKISRGSSGGGLINLDAGETIGTYGVSPKGTQWGKGTLAGYMANPSSVTFGPCPFEAHQDPSQFLGNTYVVHLTNTADNIFLQVMMTNWGGEMGVGDHTFGYIRSTPAAVAPTVTVTNPANNAFFAAPANVSIGASAAVSGGTVTNVQFFTNGASLKSLTTAPFTFTASSLAVGAYTLKAVATAAGISTTSAPVVFNVFPAPSVSITNPPGGAVFAAPANVSIGAAASVSGGSVTNVQFFTNGVAIKSLAASPFVFTATSLAIGAYNLTAVATASGIVATSAPVNISVINPSPISMSAATVSEGLFQFSYSANPGLSYAVEGSSNLVKWLPLVTNSPASSPVPFSNPATNKFLFYRIALLPNP